MSEKEQSLEKLLQQYEEAVNGRTVFSEGFFALLQELQKRELVTTCLIVKALLEQFMTEGVVQTYSRKELELLLPWKRTRLTERLRQLVAEGILHHGQ